jgi:hypothetical protein
MKRTLFLLGASPFSILFPAVALILLTAVAGFAQVSFEKAKNFSPGNLPAFVVTGNFDGDADVDIAVVTNGNNKVSVLLGDGTGDFPGLSSFAVGNSPTGAAVGLFNNDAILDMAVANFRGDSVTILLGNVGGTFTEEPTASPMAAGNGPFFVAAGHFDSDGNLDLAVANHTSGNVSILMGNGDGTFDPAVNIAVGNQPVSIAVADFDNDADLDLALTNFAGRSVSILLGTGSGGFTPVTKCDTDLAATCTVPGQPVSIVTGDFNGDGLPDLAVASEQGKNVSILLRNPAPDVPTLGLFAKAKHFGLGNRIPVSLTTADFNGDGALDLAAAHFPGKKLSVLLGNGDGTFGSLKTFSTVSGQFAIATDYFNADLKPDLAVANGKLSVLLNDTVFPGLAPSITVTAPDGGESWSIGTPQNITWTSNDIITANDNVRIYLSRDSGATWKTIIKSTPHDGTHTWKVKGPAKTTVRIKICSVNYPAICDKSDADFSIVP